MTSTICLWPIIAALSKALLFLQLPVAPEQFTPVNQVQQMFIESYFTNGYDKLKIFDEQELKSWASSNVNELNAILKKEGFTIQLQPFQDEYSFGVVSILDVLVKWLEKGEKSTINVDGKTYDSVNMDSGFGVYSSPNYPNPLLCVFTKSGDQVWMTVADEPLEGFALLEKINNIEQAIEIDHYDRVQFPMIDYDKKVDIKWLEELKMPMPSGAEYFIRQALQQTKFKMNDEGAHVKSAVAIECAIKCCQRKYKSLVIDKPFYLWIERPAQKYDPQIKQKLTLPFPIIAGYFDTDCWKNPGNLDL